MSASAWLECPACGAEAIESSGHLPSGDPSWTESDGGPCPECGAVLRVAVDEGVAYAEEVGA